ncbi:MAG: cytochrome c oxidase subunit 2A [Hansschlegelia sp.]
MTLVPNGAMALCGVAVALLLLGWFYVYFGIFLPRGSIG